MSFQTAKYMNLAEGSKKGLFSGGYVDNVNSLDMAPNYSPHLLNCRLDGQSIIIRPGHSLFATLTAGAYPKGIGSYLRANPSNDVLVVRHNQEATKKLVTINEAGTITPITTGTDIASNNRMTFTNIGDVIYCMNGSDDFGMLSGTTYTLPTTGLTNPKFSFSVMFNGSHRASGWSTNPNVVYKSVGGDGIDPTKLYNFTATGSDKMTFTEAITGLASANQALFYFTKNTVSVTATSDIIDVAGALSYNSRSLMVTEGAFNHDCIVCVGNNVYYLSSAIAINRIATGQNINGFEVMNLSQRSYAGITKLMDSLDRDQTGSYGEYLNQPSLIKRHFKSQGSTIPDVVVVYDTIKDAFLPDSATYMYDGVDFHQKHYSVSAIEPKVYIDEHGQDDEDAGIPFEYWTKEFYITDPSLKKILWEARSVIDINQLAVLTQEIWIDGVLKDTKVIDVDNVDPIIWGGIGTESIGEFAIGEEGETSTVFDDDLKEVIILRTKGNLNIKGKKIQFRYYNSSLAGKVRLKNIMTKIEVVDPMATALTA